MTLHLDDKSVNDVVGLNSKNIFLKAIAHEMLISWEIIVHAFLIDYIPSPLNYLDLSQKITAKFEKYFDLETVW